MEQKKNRTNINRIIKYIGNIIMILAVVVIIKKMQSYNLDYSFIFSQKNIVAFMIVTLIYSMTVIWGGVPWTNVMNALLNSKIRYAETMLIFTKSNVLKYIPGNIFQYVGRNELALRKQFKHSDVALSTLIDVCWNILSIILIAVLLAGRSLYAYITQQYEIIWKEIVLILIPFLCAIILIFVIFRKKKKELIRMLKKIFSIKLAKVLLGNFLFYAVQGIVNAGLYVVIFSIISGEQYSVQNVVLSMGAMLVAFVAGFITPGAPGGVGVREAVSLFLLGEMIGESVILSGIVIMRVLSIIGDVFSFVLVWMIERIRSSKLGE